MGASEILTAEQTANVDIIERICSSLSLLGSIAIIISYWTSTAFRKPVNRLVYYASFGNLLSNVATFMATAPFANLDGPLCQVQGALIQTFMVADAYWAFAMALNVYLTFYHRYDIEQLTSIGKWYFLFCYGLPSIPGVLYVWVKNKNGARMYGNASLWCWVSTDFDIMRIATFYGFVWLAIVATFLIYARAGGDIYKKHKAVRNFSIPFGQPPIVNSALDGTTIVKPNNESMSRAPIHLSPIGRQSSSSIEPLYPATVSSEMNGTRGANGTHGNTSRGRSPADRRGFKSQASSIFSSTAVSDRPRRPYATHQANTALWAYTKVAMLFFTAMLVTWIPSSANRFYSIVHPHQVSVPLEYASAFVLPLQGFWNATIYMTTSWSACKSCIRSMFAAKTPSPAIELENGLGTARSRRRESEESVMDLRTFLAT